MSPIGSLSSSLFAAIQASLSVVLVILYGAVLSHLSLLTPASAKSVSRICIKLFLPALLLTKLGSEMELQSASCYGTLLCWALLVHTVSFLIGSAARYYGKMPGWVTVLVMFNNTTSYPLLLIQSLANTGILDELIKGHETTEQAVEKAKSYFLVHATVSSCLTFSVGPRLVATAENAGEGERLPLLGRWSIS